MKKFLACCFALSVLSGCGTLPSGMPPSGNLADNRTEVKTRAGIAGHLATRLSLFMVEKHPASPWMLAADPGAEAIAAQAVYECGVFGCPRVEKSPLRLCGKTLADGWEFTFFEKESIIWSEKYVEEKAEK